MNEVNSPGSKLRTMTQYVAKAYLSSSAPGAFYLCSHVVSIGDELSVLTAVGWFISIPIALGISMVANGVISGLATFARKYRYANIFTVTGVTAVSPPFLIAYAGHEVLPTYLGRVWTCAWTRAWAEGMVAIFWFIVSVDKPGHDHDAP